MGSFALDLSKFQIKTEKQLSQVVRKAALELFTMIVTRAPVDTGRFKANNQIDLNAIGGGSVLEFDKGGAVTIGRERGKLSSYALGDTIFIYNNVAYALALEYGHSDQAPAGVFRISVDDLVSYFESIVRSAK